jgi:hypothetical protein
MHSIALSVRDWRRIEMDVPRLSTWAAAGRICFIRRRILGIKIIDELFSGSYGHEWMSADESEGSTVRTGGVRACGLP